MDDADIIRYIIETYPDTDVVTAGGGTFFSIDPEKHWPNFATLVTTDEFDEGPIANLSSRPGVFRLNIGVTGDTSDPATSLSPWAGFALLCGYAVVLIGFAAWRLRRVDA